MRLSGLAIVALKALYEAPNQQSDLVALLQQKGATVTTEQAQAVGRELEKAGFIEYTESRAYADALLKPVGIKYVQSI